MSVLEWSDFRQQNNIISLQKSNCELFQQTFLPQRTCHDFNLEADSHQNACQYNHNDKNTQYVSSTRVSVYFHTCEPHARDAWVLPVSVVAVFATQLSKTRPTAFSTHNVPNPPPKLSFANCPRGNNVRLKVKVVLCNVRFRSVAKRLMKLLPTIYRVTMRQALNVERLFSLSSAAPPPPLPQPFAALWGSWSAGNCRAGRVNVSRPADQFHDVWHLGQKTNIFFLQFGSYLIHTMAPGRSLGMNWRGWSINQRIFRSSPFLLQWPFTRWCFFSSSTLININYPSLWLPSFQKIYVEKFLSERKLLRGKEAQNYDTLIWVIGSGFAVCLVEIFWI